MDQKPLLIVGHRDAVEEGLYSYFIARRHTVISSVRENINVLDLAAVEKVFEDLRPAQVILTSVRSGGIGANQRFPAEFIFENLQAQNHVIDVARRHAVVKLLFLAASCIYPKESPQPICEDYFMTGAMEKTSEPYSMAKAAGVMLCQACRKQYGFPAIIAVPATVYGPGGDELPEEAHVLGSLLAKFRQALAERAPSLTLWGSGEPRREFIHAQDLAAACELLLEQYDQPGIVNIGAGEDIAIRELAAIIAELTGYKGKVEWDTARADGAMRKLLDSHRIFELGFRPKIALRQGIQSMLQ